MYRTILAPLDGSPRAERVLPHVEELAHRFEAKVILLHVLDYGSVTDERPQAAMPRGEEVKQREEEASKYLSAWQGEFREKGLSCKRLVEHGPVVQTIIDVAERERADLIALSSHGRTGLAQVFYGSVAVGVLHRVDRPLLVVRAL